MAVEEARGPDEPHTCNGNENNPDGHEGEASSCHAPGVSNTKPRRCP
jgi:hypothetical protein